MFPVHIHDVKDKPLPEDDTFFIVAKEGPFIKKKVGVLECLVPVKSISILQSAKELVTAFARMHIKKIPKKDICKIFYFLRAVYEEHRSEGMVLLFYNEDTGLHYQIAPSQKVSGAGVDYERGYTKEGYTMIGTIHSHANFSAFHSGTDHNDETSFDGLHITIGNVMDDDFSVSASIMANGHRVMVDPEDYMSGIRKTIDIDEMEKRPTTRRFIWSKEQQKMVEDPNQSNYTLIRKYDKRYRIVNPPANVTIPKFWLENVEKQRWGGYRGGYYGGRWENGVWTPYRQTQQTPLWSQNSWIDDWKNGKWGSGFNADFWSQRDLPPAHAAQTKIPPQNVGPQKTPGVTFPAHPQPDKISKDQVTQIMAWTIKNLFKHYDIWERDLDTVFHCQKCNETYEWDEVNDDFLCEKCQDPLGEIPVEPENYGRTKESEEESESGFTVSDVMETILSPFHSPKKDKDEDEVLTRSSNECPSCAAVIDDSDELCPFCNAYAGVYNKEAELEATSQADSGEMLSEDAEKIEEQILRDAAKRDEKTTPLPDPEQSSTPLATHVQATSRTSIKEMFKKVFSKEK